MCTRPIPLLTVQPILSPPQRYSILMGRSPRSKYIRNRVPRPGSLAPPAAEPLSPIPKLKVDMDFCCRLRTTNQYMQMEIIRKTNSKRRPKNKQRNALFGLGTRALALAVLGADSRMGPSMTTVFFCCDWMEKGGT